MAMGLVACVLANEGGGPTVRDLVTNGQLSGGTGITWKISPDGILSPSNSGSSSYFKWTTFPFAQLARGVPLTLAALTAANANNGALRCAVALEASTNLYGLGWTGSNGTPIIRGQGASTAAQGSALGLNVQASLVGTFTTTTSRALFVNGAQVATNAVSITDFTPTSLTLLGDTAIGGGAFCNCDIAMVWGRVLTASEISWFYNDPYAIFQPQAPQRRYWPFTPGVFRPPVNNPIVIGG